MSASTTRFAAYSPSIDRSDVAVLDGAGPGVIAVTALTAIILAGSLYSRQLLQLLEIAWRIATSTR